MRVLALLTDGFGGAGGIAQFNRDWLAAIEQMPELNAIDVLVRHGQSGAFGQRIQQRRIGGRLGFVFTALKAALAKSPDLIFAGHLNLLPLAALLARLSGAKLVLQTHGIDAWSRPGWLKRWAIARCTQVLAVSRYTRGAVLAWSNLPWARVRVLPNTVGECAIDEQAVQHWREKLALGPNTRLLLTVGRMDARERYKGHDRVLQACAGLGLVDYCYAIVGSGDDQARLAALADALKIAGHVRFLGALDDGERNALQSLAHVFAMPSTGEGFGIVYLEALLAGTPAVGSQAGGAPDPLSASRFGFAPTDADLQPLLARLLSAAKPPAADVRGDVQARFGHAAFNHQAQLLLQHALSKHD